MVTQERTRRAIQTELGGPGHLAGFTGHHHGCRVTWGCLFSWVPIFKVKTKIQRWAEHLRAWPDNLLPRSAAKRAICKEEIRFAFWPRELVPKKKKILGLPQQFQVTGRNSVAWLSSARWDFLSIYSKKKPNKCQLSNTDFTFMFKMTRPSGCVPQNCGVDGRETLGGEEEG